MSIPIPNWLYDNTPYIAVFVVLFIVLFVIFSASADIHDMREACADIGMLYDKNAHGCVEGVNVP